MNVPADGSDAPDQTRSAPDAIAFASIPTRHRRQAMDWSLVLVSQNIESIVWKCPETRRYELHIAPEQFQRAQHVIALYEEENRGLRWRRIIPAVGGVWFDFRSLLWVFLMCVIYFLNDRSQDYFKKVGQFDAKQVAAGEWWRAFTAECLHVDLPHLASNLTTGLVFLGLAMARFGVGGALFGSLVAGALANGLGFWLRYGPRSSSGLEPANYLGLGASGTVMAALGMVAISAIWTEEWRMPRKLAFSRGFLAGVFLLVLFGFNPTSDILVHVAGFAFGALLGACLHPFTAPQSKRRVWDGWYVLLSMLALAIPWALAVRH